MANPIDETGAVYISKLAMNGNTYTIKDEWARGEIADVKSAIAGGVHFRGVSTTAIADGDNTKDLTIVGKDTPYAAATQVDGDLFIYNNGTKNLEFVVSDGKYSEFGSTSELGALAFADRAAGSVEVPIASAITLNDYTPQVSKGTLEVTTENGTVTNTATAATFAVTATAATLGATDTAATFSTEETAAGVTNTATEVTAAGPTVSLTYTTGTFTALGDVTYDAGTATLTISSVTSDAFTKVASVDSVGNITITYDKTTGVSYDKTSAVTYVKATNVTYDKVSAVTYDKASGTFLSSAALNGDLSVTAAAPTATITNPTITVTVDPVART